MKPNTPAPELTHRREDIARDNRELRKLCAAIQPAARKLIQQGVARATAQEVSAVQAEEADILLKSVLAELDEYIAAQPAAMPALLNREPALVAPELDDEAEDERQWIDQMAGDWALAAAGFWLELGHDLGGQTNRQAALMANLAAGQDDDVLAAFDLVAARFYVGPEGRELLKKLHRLTQRHEVMARVAIEVTPAVSMQELTGAYVHK